MNDNLFYHKGEMITEEIKCEGQYKMDCYFNANNPFGIEKNIHLVVILNVI